MALKADRLSLDSDISFFMNEVAERGGIVTISTVGSGAAMDQSVALCTYAASPSGKQALGVLMCDMVNNDLTRIHENWYKEEVQKGGKVTIWTKCQVTTDMILPGETPVAGSKAYVAHSGNLATKDVIGSCQQVGVFLSSKDEDGFAKVAINLP